MNPMKRSLSAAVTLLAACNKYDFDTYNFDSAYYEPSYYSYETDYLFSWYDPFGAFYFAAEDGTIDLAAAAAQIAARAPSFLKPATCVTATPQGATVSYVFSGCTGAFSGR